MMPPIRHYRQPGCWRQRRHRSRAAACRRCRR
jgi:hypothetical protein